MRKTRIGILGYVNLGKGVELSIRQNADMELAAVFTRRSPETVRISTPGVNVFGIDRLKTMRDALDVLILCGGSATDLPEQGPECAALFTIVDGFDTHAKIPDYFAAVDKAARAGGNVAIISVGWDPGMFSINRLYANCVLPQGKDFTFWGTGISQGHSDAIRRIEGVADGKQYTIPVPEALETVRGGGTPDLTPRQSHTRHCYVVAKPGADKARIEHEIKSMPNYFSEYNTVVNFVSQAELDRDHSRMPHGGFVLRRGTTGNGTNHLIEYSLKLDSNPEFTANVLVAYARAAHRLASEKAAGAKTVFDIPPAYLSPKTGEELRKTML